jgi:outer membrane PBP1 activator LpoA protein
VLIGGFIVLGEAQRALLVRGIGPSLTFGGKLEDPTLELFNANGDTLAFNNNWRDSLVAAISETSLAPENDAEAAIRTILPAGNYTAIVRGANDTTGIALVEVYDLD